MIAKEEVKIRYIDYLIKEMSMKKETLSNIKSIYVGGGSPSSLSLDLLERLFLNLRNYVDFSKLNEFTIEANPKDVTCEFISLLEKYHINRISLGVQSVRDDKLLILGRNHNFDDVTKAIKIINNSKIKNINVDYMYGVEDTITSVLDELKTLISLPINHISCYSLILEEHTILFNKYQKGEFKSIDEDLEADIYYQICDFLKQNGFIHYEISNFAKPGYSSFHNLLYWNNEEYQALGCYGASYVGNVRSTNINNLQKYFQGIDNNTLQYLEYNELSIEETIENEIMLGLRKIEGVNTEVFFNKFHKHIEDIYPITKSLIENGLLIKDNNRLFIPENKLYISNAIIMNFI